MGECVFCDIDKSAYLLESEKFYAIYDKYPVNKGHLLVIPKRHVLGIFQLTKEEQEDLNLFIFKVKKYLYDKYTPDGLNIGINDGKAAGQTIFHLHIHFIPRYFGDIEKPEGGVRGVIPEKRLYRR